MPTILGPIVPGGSGYPAVDDSYVGGGFRSVENSAARDAIPASRRKAGMLCYLQDEDAVYKLGADEVTWSLFFNSGSSATFRMSNLGDGRHTPANHRSVYLVGDSLSYPYYAQLQPLLQALHPSWTVSPRGNGGDYPHQIRQRMFGGYYIGPQRGIDALDEGSNVIEVRPYNPPNADNDAYDWWQMLLMRTGTVYPLRYHLYNHGEHVGALERLEFIGRCAGSNQVILYEPVDNTAEITNAGNEAAVLSGANLSAQGATMEQSQTVGSALGLGSASARFTCDGSSFHGLAQFSPTDDSVYEIEAYAYLPATGGVSSVSIGWNGAGCEHLSSETSASTTTTNQWVRLHALIYVAAGTTAITIANSSSGVSGQLFYLDNVRIRRKYAKCTDHGLLNNRNCFLAEIPGDVVDLPDGLRVDRNYYIQRVVGSDDTVELLLSSGGSQDTYTGTGWCVLKAGWRGTYDYTPPDGVLPPEFAATDYAFTVEPEAVEYGGIWVVWAGTNASGKTVNEIKADIIRIVSMCKSGRVIILTPMGTNAARLGSAWRDRVIEMERWCAEMWPDNSINATQLLMANHDGSAQDLLDVGDGVHPASLRSDTVHLNTAGDTIIANAVFAKLVSLGYV